MNSVAVRVAILLALGAVDYELHRPWRLFVLLAMLLYVWQWTSLRDRRAAIRLVRQRRHRLANRLQLVVGWFQLGSYNNGHEALAQLLAEEASESRWFRDMPSRWVYLFLRWDGLAEERGMVIKWDDVDSLVATHSTAWMLEWRLSQALRLAAGALFVSFQGRGFRVVVAGPVARRLPRGWHAVSDGVETWWAVKPPAVKPSDSSEEL